jgi:DNA-binding transcriptional MerR regulator/effector-binding domain-containing protein
MTTLVGIGDFSRMTHLSVKALRHYHDVGLLEPAEIDRQSGYRRYDVGQASAAILIRRFRELDMPIDQVREVLAAPDAGARNKVIVTHLERMEGQLQQTMTTVESLRRVLETPLSGGAVEYRSLPPVVALAVGQWVTAAELEAWWFAAFNELRHAMVGTGLRRSGDDGCLYPTEMFELEEGEMVAYVPIDGGGITAETPHASEPSADSGAPPRPAIIELPAIAVAVVTHIGSYDTLDQSYAALGTVVSERAAGADGPIREHYRVGPFDDPDATRWQTEICWPVLT